MTSLKCAMLQDVTRCVSYDTGSSSRASSTREMATCLNLSPSTRSSTPRQTSRRIKRCRRRIELRRQLSRYDVIESFCDVRLHLIFCTSWVAIIIVSHTALSLTVVFVVSTEAVTVSLRVTVHRLVLRLIEKKTWPDLLSVAFDVVQKLFRKKIDVCLWVERSKTKALIKSLNK